MSKKTGYLHQQLKLFYLSDQRNLPCPYHYHDFDKITIFLQGNVTYDIEGISYVLQPYDIVVVSAGQMHRPIISDSVIYERIIAYIAPSFVDSCRQRGCDLSVIFQHMASPILRQSQEMGNVFGATCRLRQAFSQPKENNELLQETIFLEFMILLSQAVQHCHVGFVKTSRQNEKIQTAINYINAHLSTPLSIQALAEHLYISPDYLMHLFKSETGCSVAQYITTKRLMLARSLMEQGKPLTTVCYDSGFKNYSTFYRAWKHFYHTSPKQGTTPIMDDPVRE
ncbi:MAG: AraC family transcriptional regulator [Megasphaera sp.]|jgi:AraC-like DNA-binding protein|nr:AraC family transcriptional regulator [Megasphaera sp.]MCH4187504.1 AraC family transcriptional regulator [Megasphaera sp.]MCH4217772.1 AraC family transcriptional regulator [Megasphaera sp.]